MRDAAAALFAFGILISIPAPGQAAPITINIGSPSGGTGVLHAPGTLGNGANVYLGAVPITGDLGAFESYCVDLQHYDVVGANQVTLGRMSDWSNAASPVHPSLGGGAASWLYNEYALGAVGQKSTQAALSLAIWNSLYDDDHTVSGGTGFWVTGLSDPNYATLADGMLAALALNTDPLPNDGWLQTRDLVGTHYAQDFIAPVPEPSSVFLLVSGLAGLTAFRRRISQG
jgi:hypothetical protein